MGGVVAIVSGLSLQVAAQDNATAGPADTIVWHAKVYTVNAKQPWAEAVAIRGATIVAVGSDKEMEAYRGSSTRMIDAEGHLLLPGFEDCHIHFLDCSLGLNQADLNGASTVAEIQNRVKQYAASHVKEPWITGMGWTYPTFGPSAMPDKKILDEGISDRPVYLVAFDGHSSWASSKSLAMAAITKKAPDPPNGKIVRDARGEATGALMESAVAPCAKFLPNPHRQKVPSAYGARTTYQLTRSLTPASTPCHCYANLY